MKVYENLIEFWVTLFQKKQPIIPQKGEHWQIIDNRGPWETENKPVITIRDVKDGWVRYKMGSTFKILFQDERLPIETFVNIYRKIQ